MKAKYSKKPNDYELKNEDHYRVFGFNWSNINSLEDFKKANMILSSKTKLLSIGNKINNYDEAFGKWIEQNPDFEKYFIMCY